MQSNFPVYSLTKKKKHPKRVLSLNNVQAEEQMQGKCKYVITVRYKGIVAKTNESDLLPNL